MVANDESTVPATADAPAPPGRIGRYSITRVVGAGGMGVVLAGHDPELDRAVAIKLLNPGHRLESLTGGAARLEREARAMARVAHPNVVTVYEVGRADDRVFLAMELVVGTTLRAWCAAPRPWREVVAMFVAAGRGLAAAHAQGLVHLDFKPDNVLIGADGRPRVTDFGLAAPVDDDATATTTSPGAGTPAYMAPEQWRGADLTPACDQFALCVAWWEALTGARPFQPRPDRSLDAVVRAGEVAEPRRRGPHPRWLEAYLRRGLAVAPGDRWPSVTALLDAIEGRLRRRARLPWLAAATGLSAAVALAIASSTGGEAPTCRPPTAQVAEVWSPARAAAVTARVRQLDPAGADARLALIADVRERYLDGWSALHGEVCAATRLRHEQSDSMFDARMRCLHERKDALSLALGVLAEASDGEALDRALAALVELPPVAACTPGPGGELDEEVVAAPRRADLDRVLDEVQRITAQRNAGRLHGLRGRARGTVETASALGHPRTEAVALSEQAAIELDLGTYEEAEATLRPLIQLAARARAPRLEAAAWTRLIFAIGFGRRRPDDGLALVPAATAAIERAGNPVDLRARLWLTEAQVLDETPRVAEAIERLLAARAALAEPTAAAAWPILAIDIYAELGNAYARAERGELAVAALTEALARYRQIFGPNSLDEARTLNNLSDVLQRLGRFDEALGHAAQAEAIWRERSGVSLRVAELRFQRATALGNLGRWDEAAPLFASALTIARAKLAPTEPRLGVFLGGHATGLEHQGRLDEADAVYAEALACFQAPDVMDLNFPIYLYNRGELRRRRGRWAEAAADHRLAIAEFERQAGRSSSLLLYPLVGLGRTEQARGARAAAVEALTRARTLAPSGADQLQVALATAYLGLAVGGRRGARLTAEGRAAIAALVDGVADARAELAQLDAVRVAR